MDFVSSLPDDALCHILSYLPTKQAAVTSALAKRWLNLWKLVPNLDIDDSVFLNPKEGKGQRDDVRQSFVDFVDRVLALQGDSPVKKFCLQCITGIHPDCVNRWICNVLQRGVSVVELFIDFSSEDIEGGYKLPVEMFVSRTLVELKIRSIHCVEWWRDDIGGAFLPMLKTLDVDSEMFKCSEIEMFLPSFPVLEDLRTGCMEWIGSDVTISSTSLETLSIHGTGCEGFANPKSISFDTPNLLSLHYSDLVAEDYPLVSMKKLTEATIRLILFEYQIERLRAPNNDLLEDDVVLRFGNVVKIMNGIQDVEKLSLQSETLEVLSLCCESMPVFKYLKFLGITNEEGRGWQAMPVLLRSCPQLETIVLQGLLHHVTDKCGDACPCIPREDKGRSLKSCPVKLLEIYGFRATKEEMRIIRHFLEYFPCLDVMKVYIEEYDLTQLRTQQMSKLFEVYSKYWSCNIQIMIPDD